jgi:outer membrane protein assembly factor BamB
LQRLRWTAAGDWTWDTDAATGKTLVLPLAARVVGVSAVLTAEGAEPRVAVADAGGTVTLVQADKLKPLRRWKLPGKCTAGPFVRGGRLGCVVQGDTLVWLNPDNAEPEWTHRVEGAAIVGQPQLVGDAVIVADQAGRIVALDPATGKPLGEGYTLQAIAVPAAAPLAYGKDRLFAPLSDGTVLVLPLDKLK